MKILGGNQVVFYTTVAGGLDVQLTDCLEQLEEYMDEEQIYPGSFIRHNIYVNVKDWKQFQRQKKSLEQLAKRRFPLPMLVNFIYAAPGEGDIALESTHVKSTVWNCLFKEDQYGACQHIKQGKSEVVIGSVKVDSSTDLLTNAEKAFEGMDILLAKCGMGYHNLVRQWNYIERMHESDFGVQRYQVFNDVRTKYYEDEFVNIGFPASTEIGVSHGGVLIEFLAIKDREQLAKPVSNPMQKAPHEYSQKVLSDKGISNRIQPTTPKVERAQFIQLGKESMVFITSTPAIVGERLAFESDVKEQVAFILENFNNLIAEENLKNAGIEKPGKEKYTLLKAYVSPDADMTQVLKILLPRFSEVPLLLIQAELPRKPFLVELEAELVF